MNKIDFLKNKKVTILCSGPTAKNYEDDNEIVIVPNRSILLPQLQNYKKIIWINGTGWKRNHVYSWWKELASEVKCRPSVILARKSNSNWDPLFDRFEKEFTLRFSGSMVSHLLDNNKFGVTSTGMKCVELAISSQASSIHIAGMEMGIDTKYCSTLTDYGIISKMGNDSFRRHLEADKRYLNSLEVFEMKTLKPSMDSGLYKFIKNKEIR